MPSPDSGSSLGEEFKPLGGGRAARGNGADHLPIALPVLEKMRLAPTDNVLDVGSAGVSRRLRNQCPRAAWWGGHFRRDIRHARRGSVDFDNLMFLAGESCPNSLAAEFLSHVIFRGIFVLLAQSRGRASKIFFGFSGKADRRDLDQLLPRHPHCTSGEVSSRCQRTLLRRRMGRAFPHRRFYKTWRTRELSIARRRRRSIRAGGSATPEQLAAFKSEGALLVYGIK